MMALLREGEMEEVRPGAREQVAGDMSFGFISSRLLPVSLLYNML